MAGTHLKPVDSAAVDEGRELPQSVPKGVPYGTERYDDVQILTTSVHEKRKKSEWGVVCVHVTVLRRTSYRLE